MLKLCGFHISNYFNKTRIAMLEKGVPFELDPTCRPSQKEEFLARTPMGKVPFLHVKGENTAKSLYEKIGFRVRREIHLTVIGPGASSGTSSEAAGS